MKYGYSNNRKKPWTHHASERPKGPHVLHDSVNMKYPQNRQTNRQTEDQWLLRVGRRWEQGVDATKHETYGWELTKRIILNCCSYCNVDLPGFKENSIQFILIANLKTHKLNSCHHPTTRTVKVIACLPYAVINHRNFITLFTLQIN